MSMGARLRFARKMAGLKIAQVSEKSGVGESSLSEYENDKREPRMNQLRLLAEVYRRPLSYFFGEGEPPGDAVVLWRQAPPPDVATDTERRFLQLCQQYHHLEVLCGERRQALLPETELVAASFTFTDAMGLARRVRDALSLGDRPGSCLFRILEEVCHIKIFCYPFEPGGAAASTVSESFGPAILLNEKNVPWRQTFDLAHELFHILTWRIFGHELGRVAVANDHEEKLAQCFASHLLMPNDIVREAIDGLTRDGSISFGELADVARQFDVSTEALLWKMHWLYDRDEGRTRADVARAKELQRSGPKRKGDSKAQIYPARYRALALKALGRGEISLGVTARYLDVSRQDVEILLQQEARFDEDIAISTS